jgi:ABC-type uncharacterized transport system YnjBCD permease subunit
MGKNILTCFNKLKLRDVLCFNSFKVNGIFFLRLCDLKFDLPFFFSSFSVVITVTVFIILNMVSIYSLITKICRDYCTSSCGRHLLIRNRFTNVLTFVLCSRNISSVAAFFTISVSDEVKEAIYAEMSSDD